MSQIGTSASCDVGVVFSLMAIIQAFGFALGISLSGCFLHSCGVDNEQHYGTFRITVGTGGGRHSGIAILSSVFDKICWRT